MKNKLIYPIYCILFVFFLCIGKLAISKQGDFQDKYPIIAKIDASLNLQYYKVLDNHVTDSSLKHGAIVQGMVQVDDSSNSDYYLVAKTYRQTIIHHMDYRA